MGEERLVGIITFLIVAVATFVAMALGPWPACLWCEYEALGVYRVTADGLLGAQVEYGDYHLGDYTLKNFMQYFDFVKYPNVRLPLDADTMICARGIYVKVSYPTAVIDCGRSLPPPGKLLRINATISSGIYPKVCFDDNCIRLLPGHYVLWYGGGRIFMGKLNTTCRAVQPRVVDVDYPAARWVTYPNEFRVTSTSYVCTHGCTVTYNVSGVLLKFTTAPSMYISASSVRFTAEECALN